MNKLDSRATPLHYQNTIAVAKVQDLIKIGTAHTLRLGLEYRDNKVNTTPVEGAEVGYSVWAPSVMWNWVINPKVSVTSAVRFDSLTLRRSGTFPAGMPRNRNSDWDRSIEEVSLNLGAVFAATDRDTFRATYARGVQAPTLVELGSRQVFPTTAPPVGVATVGNPTLQPAIVTSYELTYERALPELNARIGVKAFAQRTEDVKSGVSKFQIDVPATATTYAALTYLNIGDSEMKGSNCQPPANFRRASAGAPTPPIPTSPTRPSPVTALCAAWWPSATPAPSIAATWPLAGPTEAGRRTAICIASPSSTPIPATRPSSR
uniref:TonB-dependent receptor n=1 Tax=Phenylobacterium glaciei TaxID=2803784 RepID=A0A974S8M4_9CAUL|nr:TonB-dependent receptor [Phenylobacterium glaciei]